VVVGFAGTAFHYNVSVFGAPVALAARCAGVKPADSETLISSSVVVPAADWADRQLDEVLPENPHEAFKLLEPRDVEMKGLGSVQIREIHNTGVWFPTMSAEERATEGLALLRKYNRYWPLKPVAEASDDGQPS
jgi:hypothetical protein